MRTLWRERVVLLSRLRMTTDPSHDSLESSLRQGEYEMLEDVHFDSAESCATRVCGEEIDEVGESLQHQLLYAIQTADVPQAFASMKRKQGRLRLSLTPNPPPARHLPHEQAV